MNLQFNAALPARSRIELYNMQGLLVRSLVCEPTALSLSLDLRDLADGTYILRFHRQNEIYNRKVIKVSY